jgi:septal ring factor EnvC (AmiA/AmiB activator)
MQSPLNAARFRAPADSAMLLATLHLQPSALSAQVSAFTYQGRLKNEEVRSRRWEEKLEQKEAEITELKQTVDELTTLVQSLNRKLNGGAP